MNIKAMPPQRNTRWYMSDLDPEKGHQPPNQKDSPTHKLCLSILYLLVFGYVPNSQAIDQPVLGTIGIDPSGALTTIQSVAHGTWLGGWNLGINHTVVPGKIGDFDGDGYDEFVIRSAWGIGVIGNDANDKLIAKALTSYGTNVGQNWMLSEADEVIAVGRFGSASNAAQMVLKGTNGFAFVRAYQGSLQALTVVPYNSWIIGGGVGWRVGPGDRIIGVGRLNGGGDCLVVTSGWGMGVWVPTGSSGTPTLLSIHQNGTTFRNPNGRTWKLDTTDPRFRFLGASDIDKASDKRAEMVLVSSSGLAILHEKGTGVWGESLDLHFALKDGEPFTGTPANSTLHWLVKVADFNKSGGADFLFQHQNGIIVLGKNSTSWSFSSIANHVYGPWIGGWNFNGGDLLSPLAGDFDGDEQRDLPITSAWGIGFLSVSGSDFQLISLVPYSALPIIDPDRLVGVGKFDHSGRRRLLFKNSPAPVQPSRPAVLTYHNDNNRTGLNPNETILTPAAIRQQGLRLKCDNLLGGVIEGKQEEVSAQVLYVPDLSIDFNADGLPDDGTLHDTFFVATNKNNLYAGDANTCDWLYPKTFPDWEDPSVRKLARGILSTPVIDYDKKVMYIVYGTMNKAGPQGPGPHGEPGEDPTWDTAYWLVAWDMQTARTLRRVKIDGSYPRLDGPSLPFLARNQGHRPALLLSKGSVYIAFGSRHQEYSIEYHGWVFRYDASTFEQLGVFNTSPNEKAVGGRGAGIWQGGGGLVADELGQVYLMTGNGPTDQEAKQRGAYGDHFLKFGPRGYTLQLRKTYTPRPPDPDSSKFFVDKDWDLGSGGPLLIPGTDRLLGGGKEGIYYVLNRDTFQLVQDPLQAYENVYDSCEEDPSNCWRQHATWAGGPHLHGNPAYWNGYVYQQGEMDYLKAYRFNFGTGRLEVTPLVATDLRVTPFACNRENPKECMPDDYHGAYMTNQLSVSSKGNDMSGGVVWATLSARKDNTTGTKEPKLVHNRLTAAYHAATLQCLWSVDISGATGEPTHMPKSVPPTIADGKIFIPNNNNEIKVYELGPAGQPPGPSGCP